MNTYFTKITFGLLLLTLSSSLAQADEVLINANYGDKNTQFRLKPVESDYLMSYLSNYLLVAKTKIGKKNYQYVVRVANEIISFQAQGAPIKPADCNRDSTLVQYTNDAGKVFSTKVCLLANTEQSKTLLNLINVMAAGL